jgi:hypothetical protein
MQKFKSIEHAHEFLSSFGLIYEISNREDTCVGNLTHPILFPDQNMEHKNSTSDQGCQHSSVGDACLIPPTAVGVS